MDTDYKHSKHKHNQGHNSNGSAMRGRTDGRYQVHYLPASLSYAAVKNGPLYPCYVGAKMKQ